MTNQKLKINLGGRIVEAEIVPEDRDLDAEPITLSDGTVLDEATAAEYGRQVADRAAVARRRGRPSLNQTGAHSPQISARIDPALKERLRRVAERQGIRESELVRRALEEYVAAHRAI